MSKNINTWPPRLPAPTEKVFLGMTKTVKDKYDPKKETTYEYWKLPGSGCQWVRR